MVLSEKLSSKNHMKYCTSFALVYYFCFISFSKTIVCHPGLAQEAKADESNLQPLMNNAGEP
jgi:hypothetical protein